MDAISRITGAPWGRRAVNLAYNAISRRRVARLAIGGFGYSQGQMFEYLCIAFWDERG